tara:strand:+ start:3585 stop:5207 length:1623 start_codon:yes stop_codon:yes gene_type:complete
MPSLIQVDGISSYTLAKPVLINDQFEIGPFNEATGSFAFARGLQTVASGDHSSSQGFATTASGDKSHAEGDNTTADGYASHAEGQFTNATGNYSHAEGNNTTASFQHAHAEGSNTLANGFHSHAEGQSTTASGQGSHAEGQLTTSSGVASHAEGEGTDSSGPISHAEGQFTIANGLAAHSEGYYTIADGNHSLVTGRYNLEDTTEGAFIVGNGTNLSGRSNLLKAAGNEVEVFGKTTTETIQISDGAFDGYVLTSDASGNGTWQSIGALSDTFVTAASLNGTDLEIDRNNGQPQIVVDLSSLVTPPGIDTFVTNAALNGLTLEIDRNQGQPQLTVDLSSLAVDTNNYLTNATLNGTLLELDRFGLSTLTVDLASINTDTFVVSGVYDDVSNTITLTRNDAGTIDITGIADSYVTGAALNGSTLELTRNEGLPTLFVDLSSLLDNTTTTVDAAADPSVTTDIIFYSASSPGGSIYLNSALNVAGKKVVLIRVADTNTVTLVGSGGAQLNGSGTKALPTLLYSTTTCISDGTNWYCTNGSVL